MLENNLTEGGIALEVAVGGGNLIEREDTIDDRTDDALSEQRDDLRRKGARRGDLFLERPGTEHGAANR
jgi:hypothetical protein